MKICYFTATGNCLHIVKRIGTVTAANKAKMAVLRNMLAKRILKKDTAQSTQSITTRRITETCKRSIWGLLCAIS